MIDGLIETHLRARIAEAYPDIEDDQVLVKFPLAVTLEPQSKRGPSLYAERLTVNVMLVDYDKVDRHAFIALLPRCRIAFDGTSAEQKYIRTEQKDFIEIIKTKGTVFVIQYQYDVT